MATAFVRQNKNAAVDGTAVTSCSVTLPAVTAGSLIAVYVKYEGTTTTTAVSDGTNALTGRTEKAHSNNDVRGRWFYLLAHPGSAGTKTFTCTFGAARSWWAIHVFEFSYTGTASYDTEPAGGGGAGSSTAPNSGNMTTTGTDEIVLGGYCNYSGSTISAPKVGGVAASGLQTDGIGDSTWYRLLTATMTGAASATISPSGAWVCGGIAFKVTAGATDVNVDVGVGAASATGNAPSVLVSGDVDVSLGAGAATAAGFAPTAQNGAIQTPILVQALLCNSTRTSVVSGTIKVPLPNPSLANNCLALGLAWATASGTPSLAISDDQGNTWESVASQANGDSSLNLSAWIAKGAAGGTRMITITVTGGTIHYAQPCGGEFCYVDTADPIDDVASVSGNDSDWSPGALTTTADNALVVALAVDSAGFIPYGNFTPATDFELLNADRMNGFAWQYGIQATAGSVTPGMTASQFKPFIAVAFALKAGASGTAPTAPVQIRRATWVEISGPTDTDFSQQAPNDGNLIAVGLIGASGPLTDPAETRPMTALVDTAGNTYTRTTGVGNGQSGFAQWGYTVAASPDPSNVVTLTVAADNLSTAVIYDIVAPGVAFDTRAVANDVQADAGDLTTVSITPGNPDGLVLVALGINAGAIRELIGTAYLSDNPYTNDEDGGGNVFHQDNGWGHVFNATTDPLTFEWSNSNVGLGEGVQDWAAEAIAFSAPPAGGVDLTLGAGDASAAGLAPTVDVTANVALTMGAGTAAADGLAAALDITNDVLLALGAGDAVANGQIPTVDATANVFASLGVGVATADGSAPDIAAGGNQSLTLGAGAATADGNAPSLDLTADRFLTLGLGAASAASDAPQINRGADRFADLGTGSADATGNAPTLDITADVFSVLGVGAAVAVGAVPGVLATADVALQLGAGAAVATGYAPTINAGGPVNPQHSPTYVTILGGATSVRILGGATFVTLLSD